MSSLASSAQVLVPFHFSSKKITGYMLGLGLAFLLTVCVCFVVAHRRPPLEEVASHTAASKEEANDEEEAKEQTKKRK